MEQLREDEREEKPMWTVGCLASISFVGTYEIGAEVSAKRIDQIVFCFGTSLFLHSDTLGPMW